MEAIILAGGLGTRLRSRLTSLPKAMALIDGKPFLEILLDQLVGQGCQRIVLSIGYRREAILERFGTEYRGVPLHAVVEESPLGTGGAIRLALEHANDPEVLVMNGDTYLDVDFRLLLSRHRTASRPMTIAVTRVGDVSRYGGVVLSDEYVIRFIEKDYAGEGWINGGVYVMDRSFPWPENLPPHFSFEFDVLMRSLPHIRPAAYRCNGQFLDIGTPEDLDRAQIELSGCG